MAVLARVRRWLDTMPRHPESIARARATGYDCPEGFAILLRDAAQKWMDRRPVRWLPRRLRWELLHRRLQRGRPFLPWAGRDQLDLLLDVVRADLARHAAPLDLTDATSPEELVELVLRETRTRE